MEVDKIEDIYELSPMQQGLLFHTLTAPNSGTYFEQLSCTLQGEFNVAAFRQAWQQVVDRHPILRTAFFWEGLEQPYQVVYRQATLPWEELDWRDLSAQEQQTRLEELLVSDRQRGFELSQPTLLRLTLIQLTDDTYQFIRSHHHILLDGWSWSILWEEVYCIYQALCQGKDANLAPVLPFRDYITWLQQQDLSSAEAFWQQKLKGFTAPTKLMVDQIPNSLPSQGEDFDNQHIFLSESLTDALQSLTRKHQLTLNVLIQGVWAVLLSRYSGEQNVVFGATSSGRPPELPGVERIAGLFLNTLPLRVEVSPKASLLTSLKQLQIEQIETRQYEYTALSQIQRWSEISPGLPLFESIVVFNNFPLDQARWKLGESIGSSNYRSFEKTNYPLTLTVVPSSQLKLDIGYDTRRFDTATIARFLEHIQSWLENIVTNPQGRLLDLQPVTDKDRYKILQEWNNTQTEYPQDLCIHHLFEQQVERTPDTVAVVFKNQQLTYRQLNTRANQLAHYLQKLGVGAEVLVGICVERSLEMLIGILGILKAGGAYVPLDPSYPQQRLAFMVQDAQVSVLLTQQHLAATLPPHQAQLVCIDSDWNNISQHSHCHLSHKTSTDNRAYVIYTSGSTGQPKGVQITHGSLVNFLTAMHHTLGLTPEDIFLSVTTLSFDIAALELYLPLIVGAGVVVVSREVATDGISLLKTLTLSQATVMQATPATWRMLLAAGWQDTQPLKILCGGEALDSTLAYQLRERSQQVWNLYGPTETTIWSSLHKVEHTDNLESAKSIVSIGRPIANTQFYILDQNQQLVPVGVTGELYIGGAGLARGYLNRPELTAQRFIANPFSQQTNARLYRTGDLARYLLDGSIEFLGRIDNQVKLRGFRIELGEIEAAINQHPAVSTSVVVVRQDEAANQSLVAYVSVQPQQTLTIPELHRILESMLPSYMVPSAFVTLDVLPLTPNGKVDRKALPAADITHLLPESNFVAPATPLEEMLVSIWTQVLGVEKVGVKDNFFELGGHSLLATRVVSQIRQVFAVELPLRRLFELPTVAELAKDVQTAINIGKGLELPPINRVSRSQNLPLSFAQQRLWLLDQLDPGNHTYNIPTAVRLRGSLNITALEQSLKAVMSRHETLRTVFTTVEGQPVQKIQPIADITIPIVDLRVKERSPQQREVEAKRLALAEAQRPFNLAQGSLIRATLLQLDETEYVLLLTMHHIISDLWSMAILIRELADFYTEICQGKSLTLPDLPIQYADFAIWQREWMQGKVLETQLNYWKQQIQGAPTKLELPTDKPRPLQPTYTGATQSFQLPKDLSDALKLLSKREDVTLSMTLLTTFNVLLHYYTKQEDIVVGSPIANRNRIEIEGLIGFFVNSLALRTDLSGNPTFSELLRRTREVTLGAYAHQDLPFEKLVGELQLKRDLNYNPLFQVWFTLQNVATPDIQKLTLSLPDLILSPFETNKQRSPFDLGILLSEQPEGISGCFEYKTDLFETSTIVRMAEQLEILLRCVVTQPNIQLNQLVEKLKESDYQKQLNQEKEYKNTVRQKLMKIKQKSNINSNS
ncbi:MAG: amino acid adenylation domain-containing protein [Nostoc desertorum CM1-VF14]|jgi:amino acid adenylation domain-containing protein|nr:amino acid adenylation domain-containing protein [Nostoc desertorum CM1-VF14]